MKQHTRHIPDDDVEDYTCELCGAKWPCAGVRYRQSRCGCWQTRRPGPWPWFYRPTWYFHRWSPVWLGGDEFCRRTLVIGWCVTGQIIIPLRECRGCEGCGPHVLDGVWQGGELRPMPPGHAHSIPTVSEPPRLTLTDEEITELAAEVWTDRPEEDE